jgi:hypothetical protein
MSGAYVFIGPTLSLASARAELDACYLPPVAAGDVYRLWRLRPQVIGIIDGYAEYMPAVWHKEILWMMEQGVHVFGSAGLGALRAAELAAFGMRGVGAVYQAVIDGTLDRDDEVAVAHHGGDGEYRPLSEAMVNVRATLAVAEREQVISAATRELLAAAGTALFYRDRTWPAVLDAGTASEVDPAQLAALARWLPAGQVSQQAADARAMLSAMREFMATAPEPMRVAWTTAPTTRWEAVRRHGAGGQS